MESIESAHAEPRYTDRQLRVIAEIQRVARLMNATRLSKREFDKHHDLGGLSTAGYQFGSWNRAVRAAGLDPNPQGGTSEPDIDDNDLLQEIIRLHHHLGKQPSESEMARFGKFSPKPYKDRWRTFAKAREAAYARFGMPLSEGSIGV